MLFAFVPSLTSRSSGPECKPTAKQNIRRMSRYIAVDTETTGLNTQENRIVEVGCIEVVNSTVTGNFFHSYVNPEQPNNPEAFAVHGLSDDFLSKQPLFSCVAPKLLSFICGSHLVVHNASFDVGFLDRELVAVGLPTVMRFVVGLVDTHARSKALFGSKRNSLDALCDRLRIPRADRTKHGALVDAKLLARLFLVIRDPGLPIWLRFPNKQEKQPRKLWKNLAVTRANASENERHDLVLQTIDNVTAGGCLWLN